MKTELDDIIESIINGQRKQAIEQLKESPYTLDDLFEEILDQNIEAKEIIRMYRVALSVGYITTGDTI